MTFSMARIQGRSPSVQQSNQTHNVSTLNSTDALAMVEHGSEMTLNVTTPVGIKFLTTSKFIGSHSNNAILIEVPQISDEDLRFYFQAGFWINIKALSHRGEGAIIQFRSQISYRLGDPFPLLVLSVPSTMQVSQLRKEIRYEVNLSAKAYLGETGVDCEIRDLSRGGCRFITTPMSRTFQVGEEVSLDIVLGKNGGVTLAPLKGKVCNLQRSTHYARYGVEFDDYGKVNAKSLLSHLTFDGTKLKLRS
ncbi:cation tolerance protein CutA [Vibrio navarrensis]|nr:flagellar brake protein [Vibrio navarrensis]MBE4573320.1 cation tolerance protein CutA [Vibrio navarrensis]MBE4579245.1 cation tolerance protein CutA [Vibrio navarrensis]MBE4582439.1 cation tolerance protein CutA [Vibrio navarrensis]MBE4589102.1 cation tolerance protein CutA [Vibrio navarrensis]